MELLKHNLAVYVLRLPTLNYRFIKQDLVYRIGMFDLWYDKFAVTQFFERCDKWP